MLAGYITLGDILEILPFEDPVVVLELDGEAIWAALESAMETWPSQEGFVGGQIRLSGLTDSQV
jgi:2',3'-cyclic-nucleotide 2'-phosphodiesterase (5'-nucleotidase family)